MNKIDKKIHRADIAIIGGGINGAAIAADAAGRGLKVVLCEQNDLGSGTSSWSTKLIHGGLRYLENYEFKLVREALQERRVLQQKAPHLIKPLAFVLPHEAHLKPAWMIRAGLFLYDRLASRGNIPGSRGLKFNASTTHALKADFQRGFEYYDCQTDDHRLVILNAQVAKQHGATILPHTKCIAAKRTANHWQIDCVNQHSEQAIEIQANTLINAAGPWVNTLLDNTVDHQSTARATLIKGSHIVVPKLYPEEQAYILQTEDNRIIFTIPYQQNFTLIGTTDEKFSGDPADAAINDKEKEYLIHIVNHYFKPQISSDDIVWSYAGVRALYNPNHQDPSKITREYHFDIERQDGLPLISIFGGKITTHRSLAEKLLDQLDAHFPNMGPAWTFKKALPGGDFGLHTVNEYQQQLAQQHAWLDAKLLQHYIDHYGTATAKLLANCNSKTGLGQDFGHGLYAIEVNYLLRYEWAACADDILWRRTKYGLHFKPEQQHALENYIQQHQEAQQ
jgi:glycerol-3-phosphate dehydrogenase